MPSASTRFNAWDLVEDSLEAIIPGNGYWSTVASVSDQPPNPDATSGGPWLVMSFGGEAFESVTIGGYYSTTQAIHIDAYLYKTGSYVQNSCKLMQDVRRVVTEVLALDGAISGVSTVRLVASDQDTGWLEYTGGLVHFRQTIEFRYKTRSAW